MFSKDDLFNSTVLLGKMTYLEVVCLYLRCLKSFSCPHFLRMPIGKPPVCLGPLSAREHWDSGSCRVKKGTPHCCSQLPEGDKDKGRVFLAGHRRRPRGAMEGQMHTFQQRKLWLSIWGKNPSQWEQTKTGTGFPGRLISILGDVQWIRPSASYYNFEISFAVRWGLSREALYPKLFCDCVCAERQRQTSEIYFTGGKQLW